MRCRPGLNVLVQSVVAEGIGQSDSLRLIHLPHSTDVEVGDRLLTSGLDGVFPEGYPVAKVTKVQRDASQPFLLVSAEPFAKLDRIRYALIVWPHRGISSADAKIVEEFQQLPQQGKD